MGSCPQSPNAWPTTKVPKQRHKRSRQHNTHGEASLDKQRRDASKRLACSGRSRNRRVFRGRPVCNNVNGLFCFGRHVNPSRCDPSSRPAFSRRVGRASVGFGTFRRRGKVARGFLPVGAKGHHNCSSRSIGKPKTDKKCLEVAPRSSLQQHPQQDTGEEVSAEQCGTPRRPASAFGPQLTRVLFRQYALTRSKALKDKSRRGADYKQATATPLKSCSSQVTQAQCAV